MFEAIVVTLFGLCVGSFFNVCIYRLPKDLSVVKPRSYCTSCNKTVRWYDNIPLLSYLILRCKCRDCGAKIAFRYFLVEFITGAMFLFCYWRWGLSLLALKYVVLFSLCILVSFIDIDYRAIPGWICVVGIMLGLLGSLIQTILMVKRGEFHLLTSLFDFPITKSILGLLLCIGLSYFLKLLGDFGLWIYLSLRKKDSIEGEKEALGLGDVDFLGMVGAFLGWQLGFLTFFLAPVVSLVYGVYIIVKRKSHLIPYLPFLSLGTVIAVIWGDRIIKLLFPF